MARLFLFSVVLFSLIVFFAWSIEGALHQNEEPHFMRLLRGRHGHGHGHKHGHGHRHGHGNGNGSLRPSDCGPRCSYRCSATSHKKPCLFFCNKCCATCLCVPPGTYGNKQVCPCYNNWKTKEGGPKCP